MRLLFAFLLASIAFAQPSATPPTIAVGPNFPSAGVCDILNAGNLFVRSEDPANGPIQVLRCTQTAARAWAWLPIDHFVGATLPTRCAVGDVGFQTGGTAGQNWYGCTTTDNWTVQGGTTSGTVTSSGTPTNHQLPLWTSGTNLKGVTGGGGTVLQGVASADPSFTATPTLGVAGTSVGSLALANATSGTITLSPTTGALGSAAITFPALTGTVALGPGVYVTATDPTCTASGDIGKIWFDTTTTTTAVKFCTSIAASIGWAAVTIP